MTYTIVQPQSPTVALYTDRELLIWALEQITNGEFRCQAIRHSPGIDAIPHNVCEGAPAALIVDLQAGVFEFIQKLMHSERPVPAVVWQRSCANEPSLNAFDWGAVGVLHDNSSATDVLACLKAVTQGHAWISDTLAQAASQSRRCHLTKREEQLLRLVVKGLRNKEIAYALKISEGTVKVYFSRLFKKLEVSDRYELALLGLRHCAPDSVLRDHAEGETVECEPMNWIYVHRPLQQPAFPWGALPSGIPRFRQPTFA